MNTVLNKEALKILENSSNSLDEKEMKKLHPKDLANISMVLSENHKFDESYKIIEFLSENVEKNGSIHLRGEAFSSIFLLKALTWYLFYQQDENNSAKKYIRLIRNGINYIEEKNDDHFLLLTRFRKEKKVCIWENAEFLSFADTLLEILNYNDYVKDSDRVFMLKGKIEIGFERYLYNREYKTLISEFNLKGEYRECSYLDIVKIANLIPVMIKDKVPDNFNPKNLLKEVEKVGDICEILLYLKIFDKKEFEKLYKNYRSMLKSFPYRVYHQDKYQKIFDISKKINKDFEEEIDRIKSKKLVLRELNSVKTAYRVSMIEKE